MFLLILLLLELVSLKKYLKQSCHVLTRMHLLNSFKPFWYFLFFVGLLPHPDLNKKHLVLNITIKLFWLMIYVLLPIISVWISKNPISFGLVDVVIGNISSGLVFIVNLIACLQSIVYRGLFDEMIYQMIYIEQLFKQYFNVLIDFKVTKQKIWFRFVAFGFSVIFPISFVFNFPASDFKYILLSIFYNLNKAVTSLICCQIIIYNLILHNFLVHLNCVVKQFYMKILKRNEINEHKTLIRNVRNIYFELWKLMEIINKCIGWTYVFLIIIIIIDIISFSYWLYVMLNMDLAAITRNI